MIEVNPRDFLIETATKEAAGEIDFEEAVYDYLEEGGKLDDLINACSNFHEEHPAMSRATDLLKLYLKGIPHGVDRG